jgi:hypothetical protein
MRGVVRADAGLYVQRITGVVGVRELDASANGLTSWNSAPADPEHQAAASRKIMTTTASRPDRVTAGSIGGGLQ